MNTVRHLMPAVRPDSWFGMRGGGIGVALPQAIGIKLAHPDRPVVALSGDGSAMYSIQALWTAAHYRLGIVAVIVNNRSYRILKQRTRALGRAERGDRHLCRHGPDRPGDRLRRAQPKRRASPPSASRRCPTCAPRSPVAWPGPGPRLIEVEIDTAI